MISRHTRLLKAVEKPNGDFSKGDAWDVGYTFYWHDRRSGVSYATKYVPTIDSLIADSDGETTRFNANKFDLLGITKNGVIIYG